MINRDDILCRRFATINRVKQRLAKGELCRGGWIQIGHPAVAEIMVHAGFDWIAIDEEHGGPRPVNIDGSAWVALGNAPSRRVSS